MSIICRFLTKFIDHNILGLISLIREYTLYRRLLLFGYSKKQPKTCVNVPKKLREFGPGDVHPIANLGVQALGGKGGIRGLEGCRRQEDTDGSPIRSGTEQDFLWRFNGSPLPVQGRVYAEAFQFYAGCNLKLSTRTTSM